MKKLEKLKKVLVSAASAMAVFSCTGVAQAAEGGGGGGTNLDPVTAINNLQKFVVNIVSAVGVIALVWGAVQLAMALKSGDPSQKTNAMLFLAGGAIMVGARFVVQAMGVSI